MTESDELLGQAVSQFLSVLKNADQQKREGAAKWLKEGLEGELSEGGQNFIDDLCELILTGEPNDVSKFLELLL
ncbi:hypothetical protein D922_00865 [Enterococcus faecalis 06-MB-DW-09]|nr:hypothetical protein D922_00865 [Enterococcus faecalis 06-MB-DW-09]